MRAWLAIAFLVLVVPRAAAQGLVQLEFSGEIDMKGGAFVEADVVFFDVQSGPRPVELALHLGEHTGAIDLAALLAARLERAGAHVMFTGRNAGSKDHVNLFVEDVVSVGLRLGHGLSCQVTLCSDRPSSLHLQPPIGTKQGANLAIAVSLIQPHTKERKRATLELAFDERQATPDIAARLARAALEQGWSSELENHEVWRPMTFADGSVVLGCSVGLTSAADWRLDITLTPRALNR